MLRLLTLARDNKAAEIKAQVAAGADVNQGNAINQTALHIACLHGAAWQLEGPVAAHAEFTVRCQATWPRLQRCGLRSAQ